MAEVFISFRNGDAPYAAALLFQALVQRFGREAVFRSSNSIPPGHDWAEEIWEQHRQSLVVLVVIGPHWLAIADEQGQRRLWQQDDWVRQEVETALRAGKQIIPVLLAGTPRFRREDLPGSIAGLAAKQSVPMDHRDVEPAVDRLAAEITAATGLPERLGAPAANRRRGWLGVWNVPAQLPESVARPGLLGALRAEVVRADGQRPVLIHGGVGVGKTQLAVEYAHRYAGDRHLAWWVDGSSPDLIWTQLAALGQAVGAAMAAGAAAALPALARELHRRGRWLLVFDGVADPVSLADPLAAIGPGVDVLITSRRPDWGLLVGGRCPVGLFDRSQSTSLLGSHLPDADPAELDEVAVAVADLPLALGQAAAFLPGSGMGPGQYAQLLRTRSRELLAEETYRYPQSLAAAWSVGLERLRIAGWSALLELLAVLAPAPVPPALLDPDPIQRADAARALAGAGLMPLVDGVPHPHGLFQAFVRAGMAEDEQDARREQARQGLARLPRPDPREPAAWPAYQPLLPHVLALDPATSPDPGCHKLLLDTAQHLVVRGDPAAARDLARAAVARWREAYGPDAPATLDALSQLAQAHFRLRDYRRALAIDQQVLASQQQRHGAEAPAALAAAHNVAMTRFAVDPRDPEVVDRLAELVAGRRRVLGPDHPDTLRSLHNLALARRAAGDLATACELDRANHRMLRDVLGPDHPDTLRSAYAVTLDLRALGHADQARELASDTYQRCRAVLGDDHPETLRCGYGLALDRWRAGETGTAGELAADTYQRSRIVLGDDHPDTLRTACLLGSVRRASGDPGGYQLARQAAAKLLQVG